MISTKKLVFVVEDLKTKDNEKVAVVSIDAHYFRTTKNKTDYYSLLNQLEEVKTKEEKERIEKEMNSCITIASAQMSLDSNKEFARHIKSLTSEAINLKEDSLNKKK